MQELDDEATSLDGGLQAQACAFWLAQSVACSCKWQQPWPQCSWRRLLATLLRLLCAAVNSGCWPAQTYMRLLCATVNGGCWPAQNYMHLLCAAVNGGCWPAQNYMRLLCAAVNGGCWPAQNYGRAFAPHLL
jgi:hypothetical protein